MSRPIRDPDVFNAVADHTRRAILDALTRGPQTAGSLARRFPMSQPAFSQHLCVLRRLQLVKQRRRGRQRIYRLNPTPLAEVYQWIHPYERFWRKKLRDLQQFLDKEQAK